jgi:hypothetical protein
MGIVVLAAQPAPVDDAVDGLVGDRRDGGRVTMELEEIAESPAHEHANLLK